MPHISSGVCDFAGGGAGAAAGCGVLKGAGAADLAIGAGDGLGGVLAGWRDSDFDSDCMTFLNMAPVYWGFWAASSLFDSHRLQMGTAATKFLIGEHTSAFVG